MNMKHTLFIVWLIAGLLSCFALGIDTGHKAGHKQGMRDGVDYATYCVSNQGVIMHDGKQYFCWYE